jgi:hypothetical protein
LLRLFDALRSSPCRLARYAYTPALLDRMNLVEPRNVIWRYFRGWNSVICFRKLAAVVVIGASVAGCAQTFDKPSRQVETFRNGPCAATVPEGWSRHGTSEAAHFVANANESISAVINPIKPLSPLNFSSFATPVRDNAIIKDNVILESNENYVIQRALMHNELNWTIYIHSAHVCSLMVGAGVPVDYAKVIRPILMSLREDQD